MAKAKVKVKMDETFDYISENFKKIVFNIEEAKAKYRSSNDAVEIMAVTKTVPYEAVNYAVECGIRLLGENRVQEYLSKKDFYNPKAQVHFIGHLQSNKIKYIIDSVGMIQSVDSFKLAKEIDRLAKNKNLKMDVLIEVNIGDEPSKSGIASTEAESLICQISQLENLKVKGLMAIPPVGGGEKYFEKMHELFIDIKGKNIDNIDMSILSMGMSSDYELAVKHGSNLVRIGTKLFGVRK